MSDLKVVEAIVRKIKEYAGNKDVSNALNALLDELDGDYNGIEEDPTSTVAIYGAVFDDNGLPKGHVDYVPEYEIGSCSIKTEMAGPAYAGPFDDDAVGDKQNYKLCVTTKRLSPGEKKDLVIFLRDDRKISFATAFFIVKNQKIITLYDKMSYEYGKCKKRDLSEQGVSAYLVDTNNDNPPQPIEECKKPNYPTVSEATKKELIDKAMETKEGRAKIAESMVSPVRGSAPSPYVPDEKEVKPRRTSVKGFDSSLSPKPRRTFKMSGAPPHPFREKPKEEPVKRVDPAEHDMRTSGVPSESYEAKEELDLGGLCPMSYKEEENTGYSIIVTGLTKEKAEKYKKDLNANGIKTEVIPPKDINE